MNSISASRLPALATCQAQLPPLSAGGDGIARHCSTSAASAAGCRRLQLIHRSTAPAASSIPVFPAPAWMVVPATDAGTSPSGKLNTLGSRRAPVAHRLGRRAWRRNPALPAVARSATAAGFRVSPESGDPPAPPQRRAFEQRGQPKLPVRLAGAAPPRHSGKAFWMVHRRARRCNCSRS